LSDDVPKNRLILVTNRVKEVSKYYTFALKIKPKKRKRRRNFNSLFETKKIGKKRKFRA
jgi:hypothetical protein